MTGFSDPEISAHILTGLRLGIPISQIAEDLHTTTDRVLREGRAANLIEPSPQELVQSMIHMYQEGKSRTEISEALNVSKHSITKILTHQGITRKNHRHKRSTIGEEMRRRYLSGERVSQIAKAMDKESSHVSKEIRRLWKSAKK